MLKSRLGIAQLVARTAKDAAAQTNKPGDRAVMVRTLGDARVLEKELQAVETALYHEEDLRGRPRLRRFYLDRNSTDMRDGTYREIKPCAFGDYAKHWHP